LISISDPDMAGFSQSSARYSGFPDDQTARSGRGEKSFAPGSFRTVPGLFPAVSRAGLTINRPSTDDRTEVYGNTTVPNRANNHRIESGAKDFSPLQYPLTCRDEISDQPPESGRVARVKKTMGLLLRIPYLRIVMLNSYGIRFPVEKAGRFRSDFGPFFSGKKKSLHYYLI
jgi:hypothetical protein